MLPWSFLNLVLAAPMGSLYTLVKCAFSGPKLPEQAEGSRGKLGAWMDTKCKAMTLDNSLFLKKGALPYSLNLLTVPMGTQPPFLPHFSPIPILPPPPAPVVLLTVQAWCLCKLSPRGTGHHSPQGIETQFWPPRGTPGCLDSPGGVGSGQRLGTAMGPPSQPVALTSHSCLQFSPFKDLRANSPPCWEDFFLPKIPEWECTLQLA